MEQNRKRSYSLSIALALHILLYIIQSFAVNAIYRAFDKSLTAYMAASVLTVPFVFLTPLYLYCKRSGYRPFKNDFSDASACNEQRGSVFKSIIGFIVAASAVVTAVNIFGMLTDAVISLFGEIPSATLPQGAFQFALTFVKTVLLAPLLEEMLFRGAVLHAFADRSDRFKILLSASLFALMHYSLTALPYAFAAGLVISFFAVKNRSVKYGLALHFVSNLMTFIFSLLAAFIEPALYSIVSNAAFWAFFAITLAGGARMLISSRKYNVTAEQAVSSTSLPTELILYIGFAAIMSVLNT